jgi:hypothetical protein
MGGTPETSGVAEKTHDGETIEPWMIFWGKLIKLHTIAGKVPKVKPCG